MELIRRSAVYVALLGGVIVGAPSRMAAAAPQSNAAPAATEDDRIIDQVRLKLASDPDVKGGQLDVASAAGAVVIKGSVETEKGKTKATKLAKKVKGVKSVDNQLTVGSVN